MFTRVMSGLAACLTAAGWLVSVAAAQQPPARIAFVVGNAAYARAPLQNSVNDAGLVAEALRSVGFEVIEGADLNQADFARSLRDFVAKAEAGGPDAISFVYFSGYAFAFEGDNYLVAADAKLERDADIPLDAIRLSDIVRALGGSAGAKAIVLDAARGLPFPLANAGLAPGLAAVDAVPNTLIAFSAAPGSIAPDGAGPYGPYATALAEMLRGAGLDLADAFVRIRARTHQLTEGQQTPWSVSALAGPLVLVPQEAAPDAPPAAMPVAQQPPRPMRELSPQEAYAAAIERDQLAGYVEFVEAYPNDPYAPRVWAIIRARREALAWMKAVEINTPQSYWTYLRRYPNGIYAADAERRLRRLSASLEPPAGFAAIEFADVPLPLAAEPAEIVTVYPPAPPPPVFLIEPPPPYFVRLPPPPPRIVGVLPTPLLLPAIPRVSPGVRIPVALPPRRGPGGVAPRPVPPAPGRPGGPIANVPSGNMPRGPQAPPSVQPAPGRPAGAIGNIPGGQRPGPAGVSGVPGPAPGRAAIPGPGDRRGGRPGAPGGAGAGAASGAPPSGNAAPLRPRPIGAAPTTTGPGPKPAGQGGGAGTASKPGPATASGGLPRSGLAPGRSGSGTPSGAAGNAGGSPGRSGPLPRSGGAAATSRPPPPTVRTPPMTAPVARPTPPAPPIARQAPPPIARPAPAPIARPTPAPAPMVNRPPPAVARPSGPPAAAGGAAQRRCVVQPNGQQVCR